MSTDLRSSQSYVNSQVCFRQTVILAAISFDLDDKKLFSPSLLLKPRKISQKSTCSGIGWMTYLFNTKLPAGRRWNAKSCITVVQCSLVFWLPFTEIVFLPKCQERETRLKWKTSFLGKPYCGLVDIMAIVVHQIWTTDFTCPFSSGEETIN